jgi:hypothetical protein
MYGKEFTDISFPFDERLGFVIQIHFAEVKALRRKSVACSIAAFAAGVSANAFNMTKS